jgi:uncharacterized protein
MRRFGYGRGSISKAVEEAVIMWLRRNKRIEAKLGAITAAAKADEHLTAVLLFGSYARMEQDYRDIDVAILLKGKTDHAKELFKYQEAAGETGNGMVDISILNDLPLNIKSRVLKEGKVLYVRDNEALYDFSIEVIKDWSEFRHRFIEMVNK